MSEVRVATATINRQAVNQGFSVPPVANRKFAIERAEAGSNPDNRIVIIVLDPAEGAKKGTKKTRFAMSLGDFHEWTQKFWKESGEDLVLETENLLMTTTEGRIDLSVAGK